MKLYLIRHGETEFNRRDVVCGRSDIPLTERGEAQARALQEKVRATHFDRVFVSPMLRARQTADLALEGSGLTYEIEPRLIEENYGNREEVPRLDPVFSHVKYNIAMRQPGGGESFVGLCHRVYSFIDELLDKYPDESILLVCHGCLGRAIRTYFVDMTIQEIYEYAMENAELICYETTPDNRPWCL